MTGILKDALGQHPNLLLVLDQIQLPLAIPPHNAMPRQCAEANPFAERRAPPHLVRARQSQVRNSLVQGHTRDVLREINPGLS
jgi:hypothetical protein